VRRDKVLNIRDPPAGWRDQLINAAIMAGIDFFSTLASISAAGIITDPARSLLAAGIAAGLGFFLALAIQRGLIKRSPEQWGDVYGA